MAYKIGIKENNYVLRSLYNDPKGGFENNSYTKVEEDMIHHQL